MPRFFFAFLILCLPFCALSQTDMFGKEKVEKTDQEVYVEGIEEASKILIIPFEEKLFYCDIMRDLTSYNKLDRQQIFDRFRNAIQLSLRSALRDSMETATFLSTDSIADEELITIYSQLGYAYMPIPIKEEEDKKGKKGKKSSSGKAGKKTETKEKKAEVGLRNGQVIAERDNTPRYMNAKLKDLSVLEHFFTNYGLNRFLFINQMDVKMDLTDPETAFLDPKRVVALHYTIMDKNGKQISGGLAEQQFVGNESNISKIISDNFYKLSLDVVAALKEAKKKEDEKKEKEENRSSKTKSE